MIRGKCQGCSCNLCKCHYNHTIKARTEEEIKQLILKLDRYDPEPKYDWATMAQDNEEGEWVRLEDVLNIFGAKKE